MNFFMAILCGLIFTLELDWFRSNISQSFTFATHSIWVARVVCVDWIHSSTVRHMSMLPIRYLRSMLDGDVSDVRHLTFKRQFVIECVVDLWIIKKVGRGYVIRCRRRPQRIAVNYIVGTTCVFPIGRAWCSKNIAFVLHGDVRPFLHILLLGTKCMYRLRGSRG